MNFLPVCQATKSHTCIDIIYAHKNRIRPKMTTTTTKKELFALYTNYWNYVKRVTCSISICVCVLVHETGVCTTILIQFGIAFEQQIHIYATLFSKSCWSRVNLNYLECILCLDVTIDIDQLSVFNRFFIVSDKIT